MSIRIPKKNGDLRRVVSEKIIRVAAATLGTAAVVSILEVLFVYDYFLNSLGKVNAIVIWIILSVLPFFILKGHRLLLDSSWDGKVIAVDYTARVEPITKVNASRIMKRTHLCEIYAETDGGAVKQLTLKLEDASLTLPVSVGDRIRHYRGLEYPVIFDKPIQICPFCGYDNPIDAEECMICHHSVIKLEEVIW